jgi:hypothetical protein
MAKKQKTIVELPATNNEIRDTNDSFIFEADNPYIDGVLRFYAKVTTDLKRDLTIRPFVLRLDDPAALATLQNYFQRCNGDLNYAPAAKEMIKKLLTGLQDKTE